MSASVGVPIVRLGERLRAAIEDALPWFDRKAADLNHRTTRLVIDRAEGVIQRRSDLRGSYHRAGSRLSGR